MIDWDNEANTIILTGGTVATGGVSAGDVAAERQAREEADTALSERIDAIALSQAGGFKGPYDSIADGIADTSNGEVFTVTSGGALQVVKNDNGAGLVIADLIGSNGSLSFPNRQAMITALPDLENSPNGRVVFAGGFGYIRDIGSTGIPDMAGWLPHSDVTPEHFGAVGDGVTDDAVALRAWLRYGGMHFRASGRYAYASVIDEQLQSDKVFQLDGAAFLYAGGIAEYPLTMQVSGGGPFLFYGGTWDAGSMGGCALRVNGTGMIDRLHFHGSPVFQNVLRDSAQWGVCAGILAAGDFKSVLLDTPTIKNIHAKPGAFNPGVAGVHGINIRIKDGANQSAHVTIRSPTVTDVYSHGPDDILDQDGILVWASRDTPPNCTVDITDVRATNCLGRAVKVQASLARVERIHITRTVARTTAYTGMAEVDIQLGSGYVKEVDVLYDGAVNVPQSVITLNNTDQSGQDTYMPFVDGVRVNALQSEYIFALVQCLTRMVPAGGVYTRADNLQILGNADVNCFLRPAYRDGIDRFFILGSNWYGEVRGGAVQESPFVGSGTVILNNIINSGSSRPLLRATGSGVTTVIKNDQTVIGWT